MAQSRIIKSGCEKTTPNRKSTKSHRSASIVRSEVQPCVLAGPDPIDKTFSVTGVITVKLKSTITLAQ
tara:strand:- start:275 stop:478 length:204 start_codon:yes stop_codon:yes gene_type:complete